MNFLEIVNELNGYIPEKYYTPTFPVCHFSYQSDGWYDSILFGEIIIWDSENDSSGTQDEIIEAVIMNFNQWRDSLDKIKLPIVKVGYEIVRWPDVQDYMEKDWFEEEAELMNSEDEIEDFGLSAYWIPRYRINQYSHIKI